MNWSEKVKWNIIFKLDKATRWGHSPHRREISYIKEELTALIGSQLTAGNNMSKIMKYLSEEYKGRYDGKVAVEIIKSLQ